MRTVGVDLAAEPARTALAAIEWGPGRAELVDLRLGVEDADIVASAAGVAKLAIDCPLGWPDPFVAFLAAHHEGQPLPATTLTGLAWRRTLSRRTTDRLVAEATGITPMSVAADRIGAVAMRAAVLLGMLAEESHDVRRGGDGLVLETYPAATLALWALPYRAYKGAANRAVLGTLVDQLTELDLGPFEALCRRSDDAFDAVVCALAARAAARGCSTGPPDDLRKTADREGWIRLPTIGLAELFG